MRRSIVLLSICGLVLGGAAPGSARPAWKERIDRLTRHRSIGVFVALDRSKLYVHDAKAKRPPASNQKLLLSMALFDRFGPSTELETIAEASRMTERGVVIGNLFVLGRGDPSVSDGSRWGDELPFEPTRVGSLARALDRAGVTKIRGGVVGNTGYFAHDWWAPGWESSFPAIEVALPTALTFNGNIHKNRHTSTPELYFAKSLTKKLESRGVRVRRRPRSGPLPENKSLVSIASVSSPALSVMVRYMNRSSANFFAEVLGKRLGVDHAGRPGTIAKGAAAIRAWCAKRGVAIEARDSSGLSYSNRVSPKSIARLLEFASEQPWGDKLRKGLPTGGQGTLEERLHGVPLRAKTGTLENISTLSGWVWLSKEKTWGEFSIMSKGMPKYKASGIEDRIVRTLHRSAR